MCNEMFAWKLTPWVSHSGLKIWLSIVGVVLDSRIFVGSQIAQRSSAEVFTPAVNTSGFQMDLLWRCNSLLPVIGLELIESLSRVELYRAVTVRWNTKSWDCYARSFWSSMASDWYSSDTVTWRKTLCSGRILGFQCMGRGRQDSCVVTCRSFTELSCAANMSGKSGCLISLSLAGKRLWENSWDSFQWISLSMSRTFSRAEWAWRQAVSTSATSEIS